MSLMTSYLLKTSNLEEFFNTIRSAKAPERFTNKFLKDLDFKSSNDRLLIRVLKGLQFLDDSGVPQQRYFDFLDQTNSGRVLAEAIEESYSDLFDLNKDAQKLDAKEIKGKFKSLTQGQKSENIINNMTATFLALCEQADWTKPKRKKAPGKGAAEKEETSEKKDKAVADPVLDVVTGEGTSKDYQLHYNIQLILPNSRDQAVFDALFTSLKKHIL